MSSYFLSLYEKLTTIYLNEGDDGHCVYKYYTSIHMEEPLNEINEELNHFNQYVLFNIKEFICKNNQCIHSQVINL